MKIVIVVGARPNFMKAAPILAAIRTHNDSREEAIEPILVHTGQHYDALMSDAFFADLELPKPDIYLGVGSGSHAVQTAEIMKKFEEVLLNTRPGVVVVVGDVNSTLACSLVTAKISFDGNGQRPLLAHVEAGLRSFDRTMPEECNRVVTDHLADLLFVTEPSGLDNLCQEGVEEEKIFFVGNSMIDSLLTSQSKADQSTILERLGLYESKSSNGNTCAPKPYSLLTLHRPANVDNADAFFEILKGLEELAESSIVIFPVHPRTKQRIQQYRLDSYFSSEESIGTESRGIRMVEPLGYLDFLCLMKHASIVITDSGGIQEETTCLGIPCVTVRENTERPITIQSGTNLLAGVRRDGIRKCVREQRARQRGTRIPEKWDGHAAERILEVISRQKPRAAALPAYNSASYIYPRG